MASPFTLAALAASAVPGIEARGVRPLDGRAGAAALLSLADGDSAVVRIPAARGDAPRLRAEAAALPSFTAGVRARLPFAVPQLLGCEPERPVLVTAWVTGAPLRPSAVRPGGVLATALGAAITALHALPTGIAEGGLPVRDAATARREADDLVDEVASTGRVPGAVQSRWREAIAFAPMWHYRPVVVHGALAPEDVLIEDGAVSGVLHWGALHVGDPAADLAWLLSLPVRGAADAVFTAYAGADAHLRRRATLLAELELAKWLRFAQRERDDALVADATDLLASLADRVRDAESLLGEPAAVLSVHEVERLLDGHEGAVLAVTTADQRSRRSASDEIDAGLITWSAAT